jgi:hypothetical protein
MAVQNGHVFMEDVTVYVTTRQEALTVNSTRFVMGSLLYIIDEGTCFMLDADGAEGIWRSMTDGKALGEGGKDA